MHIIFADFSCWPTRLIAAFLSLSLTACGDSIDNVNQLAGSVIHRSADVSDLNVPHGITSDLAGNSYVADSYSHTIRKITPAGVISTLAGKTGIAGNADGEGTAARFTYPYGITADAAGNLYVADTYNHTVRKISPSGVVSTLAGVAGSAGSSDGKGASARFTYPNGIQSDRAGNLYVADTSNHTIRRISASDEVSTLAGNAGQAGPNDGQGASARFNNPHALTVDSAGNVYVADSRNHTVRKITPAGMVSTMAGRAGNDGSADGKGATASFHIPRGIAADSAGNLYVSDTFNNTIRKISANGSVITLAGLAGDGGEADGAGGKAQFNKPNGIGVDSFGSLYVVDTENHAIRKITPQGVVSTFAG